MPTDTMPWLGGAGVQKAADGCRTGAGELDVGGEGKKKAKDLDAGLRGKVSLMGSKFRINGCRTRQRLIGLRSARTSECGSRARRFTTVKCCPMELGSAVKREG